MTLAVDYVGHDFLFGLEDGLLASASRPASRERPIWSFVKDHVDDNLRDYSVGEAKAALRGARTAVSEGGDARRDDLAGGSVRGGRVRRPGLR